MLDDVNTAFVGPANERSLDATMLVSEGDLEMKNVFAVTLEAEMPGLDDAGVNRPHRDFVNLVTFDSKEIGDTDLRVFIAIAAPRVMAGAIGIVKANRLEPRVADRTHAKLLGELSFEEVCLRALRCERGKVVPFEGRLGDSQLGPALSARTA